MYIFIHKKHHRRPFTLRYANGGEPRTTSVYSWRLPIGGPSIFLAPVSLLAVKESLDVLVVVIIPTDSRYGNIAQGGSFFRGNQAISHTLEVE